MPPTKRSCTDVMCLLLFLAFLVGWGFIAYYGKKFILIDNILIEKEMAENKHFIHSIRPQWT